jgi:hypothetical protein
MTSREPDFDIYQFTLARVIYRSTNHDRYKKLLRSKRVVENYTCPRCKAKTHQSRASPNLARMFS